MTNGLAISGGFGDSQSDMIIACVCPAWHGYKVNQINPVDERST